MCQTWHAWVWRMYTRRKPPPPTSASHDRRRPSSLRFPMKPHSVRPICRSRNPFSPSIALWQHFVLPCSLLRQQRPLSTATGTPSPQASEVQPHAENHEAITSGPGSPDIRIRKVLDIRKENKFRSPRDAKYADIVEKKSKQTRIALSIAKNAAQISADYKARIVTSMKSRVPYPEAKLPWVVSKNEASSARQRYSLRIYGTLLNC